MISTPRMLVRPIPIQVLCMLVSVWPAFAAEAQEPSAYNHTNGVAIKGYDVVAYLVDARAEKGDAAFATKHRGVLFHFRNEANRDAFAANPDKYAPQFGGYCAYGVTGGYKADTSPESFSIIDGKLYLNYNDKVQTMWRKDVPGLISKANARWGEVEKTSGVRR